MPTPDPAFALLVLQVLVASFLGILFLQSGLDKVVDRKGNLDYITGHFAKSPLAKMAPLMFVAITLLEVAAGAVSAVGAVLVVVQRTAVVAFWGAVLSALSILCLFFGQRMAKDYAGAAGLVPYFLATLAGIWLTTAR